MAVDVDAAGVAPATSDAGTDAALPRGSALRLGLIAGSVIAAVTTALAGCFGIHAYESHQGQLQRNLFVQTARQGALNLTTISYSNVETDVRRILDSATGEFQEDFQQRSQPFIEVIKQARATTQGSITEAGLESDEGDRAQVLVAVSVKTSHAEVQEKSPRLWRMRIAVQRSDGDVKISNVQFVP